MRLFAVIVFFLVASCGLVRDYEERQQQQRRQHTAVEIPPAPPKWKPRVLVDSVEGFTERDAEDPRRIADAFAAADDSMLVVYAPASGRPVKRDGTGTGTATLACNGWLDFVGDWYLLREAARPERQLLPNTLALVWSTDTGYRDRKVMIITPDGEGWTVDVDQLAPRTGNAIVRPITNACRVPGVMEVERAPMRNSGPELYAAWTAANAKFKACAEPITAAGKKRVEKMTYQFKYVGGEVTFYTPEEKQAVMTKAFERVKSICGKHVPKIRSAANAMLENWERHTTRQLQRASEYLHAKSTRIAQP